MTEIQKKTNPRNAPLWLHLQAHRKRAFTERGDGEDLLRACRAERFRYSPKPYGQQPVQAVRNTYRANSQTQEKDLLFKGMQSEVVELPRISGGSFLQGLVPLHLHCLWETVLRVRKS